MTGNLSFPCCSIALRRVTPVVVSSQAPMILRKRLPLSSEQESRVRHHRRLECPAVGLEPDSGFVCVPCQSLRAKRIRELPFRRAPLQRHLGSKEGCYRLLLRLRRLGAWILLGRRFLLQGAGRFLSCSPRRSCGRLVSLLFLRARACVLEPMPSSLCRKAQVWDLLPDSR